MLKKITPLHLRELKIDEVKSLDPVNLRKINMSDFLEAMKRIKKWADLLLQKMTTITLQVSVAGQPGAVRGLEPEVWGGRRLDPTWSAMHLWHYIFILPAKPPSHCLYRPPVSCSLDRAGPLSINQRTKLGKTENNDLCQSSCVVGPFNQPKCPHCGSCKY